MKKCLSVLLAVILIVSSITVFVHAESIDLSDTSISINKTKCKDMLDLAETGYQIISEDQFATKLSDLKEKYPPYVTRSYDYYENGVRLASQCMGFASICAYYCFGSSQYTSGGGWSISYDSSTFRAGDMVRVDDDGHSIFITYVDGTTIKYAEGNYNQLNNDGTYKYKSVTRWNVETSLSALQKRFTYKWHLSGNNLTGGGTPLLFVDLGTKFYANIVPTGAGSLAVTATSGSNVQLNTLDYSDYQKWYFERQSDKSYKITNVKMNKCLDLADFETANGTNIQVVSSNNSTAQRWYFVKNDSGYYIIPKCNTSSAMDIKGGTLKSGTNIQEYQINNSAAQRFTIKKIHTLAYNANGGTGSISDTSILLGDKLTIKPNAFTRNGYTFVGYHVKRNSDSSWYVPSVGWTVAKTYRDNDYRLKLYQPNEEYTLGTTWTKGGAENETFTFYAQWMPDTSVVRFADNYSGFNYLLGSDLAPDYADYIHTRNDAYTISIDGNEMLNDKKSLKVVGSAAGSSGSDIEWYTTTNVGYTTGYCMEGIAGDDKDMVIRFYAKSSVDGAKFYIRWGFNSSNTYKSVTLTKDWKQYTVVMHKNRHTDNYFYTHFDKAGTYYLNSVTISDGTSATNIAPETGRWACDPITVDRGGTIDVLPQPVRDGYVFLGWYTAAQGGTQVTESTPIDALEITLFAHWIKDLSYTPVKTIEANGHVYELYDNAMGWVEAEAFCESLGGHLITIGSVTEESLANQMIKGQSKYSWIGMRYDLASLAWVWVTGEDVTYTNWKANKPNTANGSTEIDEEFGMMHPSGYAKGEFAGQWDDVNGSDSFTSWYGYHNSCFICEYDTIYPDFIELNENELSLNIGETYELEAYLEPEGASNRIIWSSDDEDIATIDDNGVVTAQGEGTTWISARTVNGLMTRCEVTVTGSIIYPEEIELSAYAMELYIDETEQLYAIVEPEGASQDIIWYSEDESIATVDDNGLIRAKGDGTTWIHAQTADESIIATCTVIVLQTDIDPDHIEWNGFTGYIKEDGTICISGYTGEETDLVIPSEIDGIAVTEIEWIEGLDFIESVIIPETVRTIGYNSFHHCSNLRDVTIMGAESIEVSAFMMCSNLENVTLPETLKTIRYGAFVDCPKLTEVIIPNSVTYIEKAAFGFVLELSEDGFGYDVVPSDDYTVYGYAGSAAEEYAEKNGFNFVAVSEYEYRILDDDTVEITKYNGRDSRVVIPAELDGYKVKQIGSFAFRDYELISTIVIPKTVTDIGFGAFSDCSALSSITIPNSVTTIGESAFSGCLSLQDIAFPDSVTYVGWGALSRTPWLDSQPDGMVYVGKAAYKLKGICPEEVSIKDGTVSISSCTFEDCYALTKVDLPSSLESIDSYAFRNCSSLASIDVPDSVAFVGSNAFSGTAWLDDQPEGLIYVGKNAYLMKGNSPQKVIIKNGTVSISDFAFAHKSDLEEIILPDTLTSIGWQSFYDCESLKNVSIPNSVTSIDKYAFYDCPSLTSVTIPKSVTFIGEMAFGYVFRVDYNGSLVRSSPAGDDYPVDGFTIYGYKKTTAEQYATENDFIFIALDEEVSCILGDTDGDGVVSILDATAIQRHLASLPTTAYDEKAADADEDGIVTILDATAIQRHLASLPTNQNIGKQIS